MDFSLRSLLPEKMDQPDVAPEQTRQALRELEVINKRLGGYHVILNAFQKFKWNSQQVSIVDLGCGGGDMLRAISRWAEKNNKRVKLTGVDWNPVMTKFAKKNSAKYPEIDFKTMNVFDDELIKLKADITMNSLFCHHFDNAELVQLIKRMYQLASRAVIINDLHRHWFAYYSIKALTALFSKTCLVKYDGPLSVARSLTKKEWENILAAAGIKSYSLKWMWAWRWQIIINKS